MTNEVHAKVPGMFTFGYRKVCTVKKININSFSHIQLLLKNIPDYSLQKL